MKIRLDVTVRVEIEHNGPKLWLDKDYDTEIINVPKIIWDKASDKVNPDYGIITKMLIVDVTE
jgi:hypothetical protein